MLPGEGLLTPGQKSALAQIKQRAARCSKAALPQLRARVCALGYTLLDLAGKQYWFAAFACTKACVLYLSCVVKC